MPRTVDIHCWKCGAAIAGIPIPFPRHEECPACRADLHACRQCEFYDRGVAKSCRETVADEVTDKERANFCGYFSARSQPAGAAAGTPGQARDALAALFGDDAVPERLDAPDADEARAAADRLFGLGDGGKKKG